MIIYYLTETTSLATATTSAAAAEAPAAGRTGQGDPWVQVPEAPAGLGDPAPWGPGVPTTASRGTTGRTDPHSKETSGRRCQVS